MMSTYLSVPHRALPAVVVRVSTSLLLMIALAACGTDAATAIDDDAASAAAAEPLPAIGLQLYSLRDVLTEDFDAGMDSIQSWGITVVEGGNNPDYGLGLDQFREELAAHDLEMVSVAADYAVLRDSIDRVRAKAESFGAEYVVCFWIPHADTVLTVAEAEEASRVFNEAGQVLAEAGITLAYHPHGYEFGAHPTAGTVLDYLVQNSDHYQFEMDVYWIALPGQDPVAWLRRYPEEWVLMHLKDCGRGEGRVGTLPHANDVEWNVTLGEGIFPIAEVVREARAMGIPYLFVEDESSRVLAQAGGSAAFVRQVLAEPSPTATATP